MHILYRYLTHCLPSLAWTFLLTFYIVEEKWDNFLLRFECVLQNFRWAVQTKLAQRIKKIKQEKNLRLRNYRKENIKIMINQQDSYSFFQQTLCHFLKLQRHHNFVEIFSRNNSLLLRTMKRLMVWWTNKKCMDTISMLMPNFIIRFSNVKFTGE